MRLLLALLLLALPAAAAEVDVTRYDIEATVDPDSIEVKVCLTATRDRPPKRWELELSRLMEIRSLTVNGVEVPTKRDGERLVLDLGKLPREAKTLTLNAIVAGSPKGGGGGRKSTRISAEHARIRGQNPWYPRVPGDGASYRTVVSARKDWSVRTAGVEVSAETRGERRVWTYEQKMPVRAVGLVAGPYTVTKLDAGGGIVFDAWTLPGDEAQASGILEIAKDAFDRYRKWFGDVRVDRFSILEMPAEYGTMSGYGEAGYMLLGKGAFEKGREAPSAVALVVHEVAHTWWGQEVAFSHFAHESLASYATLRYLGEARPAKEACTVRERAMKAVVDLAQGGREIPLEDIRNFGRGLDPAVYHGLAYQKGMMILAMVEDALGTKRIDKLLAGFLEANRGTVVAWSDLRAALAEGGSAAKTVLAQWEQVGIPTLTVEHTAKQAGRRWKVTGTVTQSGTKRPFRLTVNVVAVCGKERIEKTVDLKRGQATFSLTTPTKPEAIFLDPGWLLLADAPRSGTVDPKELFEAAWKIVSDPGNWRPSDCEEAIGLLTRLRDMSVPAYAGLCRVGIGRCQFRMGRHEAARAALEEGLKAGVSGFHRDWANLRLGNLADLRGDREEALEHYRKVATSTNRNSKYQVDRAKRCIEQPYRGR